jgi:hypothetical protein
MLTLRIKIAPAVSWPRATSGGDDCRVQAAANSKSTAAKHRAVNTGRDFTRFPREFVERVS